MSNNEPKFVVTTRQKADRLIDSHSALAAGSTFTSPVRQMDGYGAITILAISDQEFVLRVLAGCQDDGPFVPIHSFTSEADFSTGLQKVCERILPCGFFMKVELQNTSGIPQSQLGLCVIGLPEGVVPEA